MNYNRSWLRFRFILFTLFSVVMLGSIFYSLKLIRTPVTIEKDEAAETDEGVTLFFSPSTIQTVKGQPFTVDFDIDTQSEAVSQADIAVAYDSNYLRVNSIVAGRFFPKVVRGGSYSNGTMTMVLSVGNNDPVSGSGTLASVSFTAAETGKTTLHFTNMSQVAASDQTVNVLSTTLGADININDVPSVESVSNSTESSEIQVFASGTEAKGQFPTMELFINNESVALFYGITSQQKKYIYKHPLKISPEMVRIKFINDLNDKINRQDRNLKVNKIVIDGVEYQTEDQSTYSVGTWSPGGCGAGYIGSEWLYCNGEFVYSQ